MTSNNSRSAPHHSIPSTFISWLIILAVFATVFLTSLHRPALLDDADASHAQAAQHMAESGDWVTLKVDGIRYLEKAPLPYWSVAALYKIAGENAATTHLPNVLAILGCAWIGWLWAGRAWGKRAGLYAALGDHHCNRPFSLHALFHP